MLALELASIFCDLRTPEEARKLVDYARAGTTGEDFYLLLYEGKTLAALGDVAGAERTASRAVELASETDDVDARGDALVSLAKIRAEAESPPRPCRCSRRRTSSSSAKATSSLPGGPAS